MLFFGNLWLISRSKVPIITCGERVLNKATILKIKQQHYVYNTRDLYPNEG